MTQVYLFIKNKVRCSFVFGVKEDCSLQAKFWDEHDDCILPHKQYKSVLVQYASALEEQLKTEHVYLKNI